MKKEYTPEETEKRQKRAKKMLKLGCFPLLALFALFAIIGVFTNKSSCEYSELTIIGLKNGKEVTRKNAEGCISIEKSGEDKLARYTIKSDKNNFSLNYYDEGIPIQTKNGKATKLSFLSTNFGDSEYKWRNSNGQTIYKIENEDDVSFYFSEPKNIDGYTSGVIHLKK